MPRLFKTVIQKARFETVGFTGVQMTQVSDGLIKRGILPRLKAGLTVDDSPAPPLRPKYAQRKANQGKNPIRDWNFTGETTRSTKTLSAQQNRSVIGFTSPQANKKAYFNQRRSNQFGVSPSDEVILSQEVGKLPPFVRAVTVR